MKRSPRKTARPRLSDPRTRSAARRRLLDWYHRKQRDLPWRKDRDPYRVWVSEIMLQQTRVAAVLEHYADFLRRFPTLETLAAARQDAVLAAWSGLGYYRRARALRDAARQVVNQYGSRFPRTAEELRYLPGIGRYTAAAIASIAFDEPVAVVDGNVERVFQRLTGTRLAGEPLWDAANRMLSRRHPGDFNQAMMELGATVCLPRQPKCRGCPLFRCCATRGEMAKTSPTARQKKVALHCALDRRNGEVFLVQRPTQASRMPGMWELPEIPAPKGAEEIWKTFRHSITVTDYEVRVELVSVSEHAKGRWFAASRLPHLPLTGLARKILRTAKVI